MKAYCIVIQKPLVVARCPLPQGACVWQHRSTNFCKYTADDLTVEQHAQLIGAPTQSQQQISSLEHSLISKIKKECSK